MQTQHSPLLQNSVPGSKYLVRHYWVTLLTFSTYQVKTLSWWRGFIQLFKVTFIPFILHIPGGWKVTRNDQSLAILFDIKIIFMRGNLPAEAFCDISISKITDSSIYTHSSLLITKLNSVPWPSPRGYQQAEFSSPKSTIIHCSCYRSQGCSAHCCCSKACGTMPYSRACPIIQISSNKRRLEGHILISSFPTPHISSRRFSAAEDFSMSFRSCTCKVQWNGVRPAERGHLEDRTHLLSMLKFIVHQADNNPSPTIFVQLSSTEVWCLKHCLIATLTKGNDSVITLYSVSKFSRLLFAEEQIWNLCSLYPNVQINLIYDQLI